MNEINIFNIIDNKGGEASQKLENPEKQQKQKDKHNAIDKIDMKNILELLRA